MRAIALPHVAEELDEPGDEVALREQHVDGDDHVELRHHLVDAGAELLAERLDLLLVGVDHVGDAHGHEHAVDGLAAPVLLEQLEERDPLVVVVLLCREAAGGVEEDRLVGEPPIAVAGTADAAHAAPAARVLVREHQARALERGGLARAGRADDHRGRCGHRISRLSR